METGAIQIITLEKLAANLLIINQNLSPLHRKRIKKFEAMRVQLVEKIAEEQEVNVCEVTSLPAKTTLQINSFNIYNQIINEFCTLDDE